MERYQVADNPKGPWMELVVTNNPRQALAKARASFDWPVVWVARMRPIRGEDILPPPEVFWGDSSERLAILFGNQIVDEVEAAFTSQAFKDIEMALTGALLDAEIEAMVPDMMAAYGKDQDVRAADFLKGEPKKRKPSLKELLG